MGKLQKMAPMENCLHAAVNMRACTKSKINANRRSPLPISPGRKSEIHALPFEQLGSDAPPPLPMGVRVRASPAWAVGHGCHGPPAEGWVGCAQALADGLPHRLRPGQKSYALGTGKFCAENSWESRSAHSRRLDGGCDHPYFPGELGDRAGRHLWKYQFGPANDLRFGWRSVRQAPAAFTPFPCPKISRR